MDERIELRRNLEEKLRAAFREEEASRYDLTAAAVAFDLYVRTCLRYAGWAYSTAAVAKMFGDDVANYNRSKRGENISRNRLLVWLGKWMLIAASGMETTIPARLRNPRIAEGESIFRPPALDTLEESLHPAEIDGGSEAERIDVFVRGKDGTVYEGVAYKQNYKVA